uniref:Putative ovule protein n=2 Tax=Solanum chacoense TaxID=4108 RepID=A0A0V0GSN3_SOLCH
MDMECNQVASVQDMEFDQVAVHDVVPNTEFALQDADMEFDQVVVQAAVPVMVFTLQDAGMEFNQVAVHDAIPDMKFDQIVVDDRVPNMEFDQVAVPNVDKVVQGVQDDPNVGNQKKKKSNKLAKCLKFTKKLCLLI